ncbi:MAG: carbohydrate kinase family protein [bacterium]|nr:carbohydrate kinase family protein [bacterium]
MIKVVTIGSVTWDNFLKLDYALIPWEKTSSGKAIALPLGDKMEVKYFYPTTGGNSANASITFARHGFMTACFGKTGDDITAREIEQRLRKQKVTPIFSKTNRMQTAQSVLLMSGGERTILGYHGASDTLTLADVPFQKLKADWWYISLAGESDTLLKPLFAFARKNNIQTAFNPSGHHIRHRPQEIKSILKDVTFFVLNADEASDLTGISFNQPKKVFAKLDQWVKGVVAITDQRHGAMISDGNYLYKAGIYKEKAVVDRTGAGDSFGSGFVAGLIAKLRNDKITVLQKSPSGSKKLQEAVKYAIKFASASATSVVETVGATEGILTAAQFKQPRWQKFPILVSKL